MARSLIGIGTRRESMVHVAYGYGLFTGGLGAHYGAEKIGCAVIPVSSGNTARQVTILTDFGPDIICCTPSYAMYLAEELYAQGFSKKDIKLTAGAFGAEPWSEAMRADLEDKLGIKACDIYGLSEIMGPSVSCDCLARSGMHVQEDHFLIEIIDPVTLEQLPYGEKGEVVFTTLTKEGMPLIRYRTRDISRLLTDKCECGRTTARMEKLSGRTDDMLIIRGVNVFPSQIESVLLEIGETAPHYMIVVDRIDNMDIMEVHVEMTPAFFSDSVKNIEDIENKIKSNIHNVLGLGVKVKLVEPKTIARSEGKAKRVIDKRTLQ
jgi:phenylacetate-CoA ligase